MNKKWWKEAVVYQIYPKSFKDSNNDGIGDLRGIIEKLDYLAGLGVNVIWICPVYKSPMDDNGYDISDYYHIDPQFGTDEDMDELIEELKKRGMKILMDLVINHTSDEHEWFRKAMENPEGEYGNYYVIKEGKNGKPPNTWRSYFGGSAWERIGDSNKYYFHLFSKKQPDLNWENEELREKLYEMVNYWLDKGLGGFRIDAISNIKKIFPDEEMEPDGDDGLCFPAKWVLNQKGIETFLTELKERTFIPHDSMTVAEANVPLDRMKEFMGDNGFFSMAFDFSYTDMDLPPTCVWYDPKEWTINELRENIFLSQVETQKVGWGALYLENHDSPRSPDKFIPKEYIGYESKTMLATLYFLLRGTPFIYQGQEIGMENCRMETMEEYDDIATHDQYKRAVSNGVSHEDAMYHMNRRSRDNSRTPFQWDSSENSGFTKGTPWLKISEHFKEINAALQIMEPDSVLSYYKKLVELRKNPKYKDILVYGYFEPIYSEYDNVIAYKRILDGRSVQVINNFSNEKIEIELVDNANEIILGNYKINKVNDRKITLKSYESIVLD